MVRGETLRGKLGDWGTTMTPREVEAPSNVCVRSMRTRVSACVVSARDSSFDVFEDDVRSRVAPLSMITIGRLLKRSHGDESVGATARAEGTSEDSCGNESRAATRTRERAIAKGTVPSGASKWAKADATGASTLRTM